ncbi:hypothetical protein [Solibacillus palustris]|nr:hypothetical protein [Solibacillus sp. MA9]
MEEKQKNVPAKRIQLVDVVLDKKGFIDVRGKTRSIARGCS